MVSLWSRETWSLWSLLLVIVASDVNVVSGLLVQGPDEVLATVLLGPGDMRGAGYYLRPVNASYFQTHFKHWELYLVSDVVKGTQHIRGRTKELDSAILFILELCCDGWPVSHQPDSIEIIGSRFCRMNTQSSLFTWSHLPEAHPAHNCPSHSSLWVSSMALCWGDGAEVPRALRLIILGDMMMMMVVVMSPAEAGADD